MTVAKGNHNIGPQDGKLVVKVYKEGVAAKMGHDLTFEAGSWSGNVTVDPDDPSSSSVQVTVDPSSLEITNASGGAKPLSDKDKGDIAKNMSKTLGRSDITFESTGVSGNPPSVSVKGNLTVSGNTRPTTLDVSVDDSGHASGKTTFSHRDFGIKPYAAPLGVLKVKDGVEIEFSVDLPTA